MWSASLFRSIFGTLTHTMDSPDGSHRSISRGSSPRIAATLPRMSCDALSVGTPMLKLTTMLDSPSCELDSMWRTPSTVLTVSSIFLVTSRSTVSGDAPSYRVVTVTTGNSTSGNRSTFNDRYDVRPSTASAAIIMVAKTGCLMERSLRNMAYDPALAPGCTLLAGASTWTCVPGPSALGGSTTTTSPAFRPAVT